AGAVGSGIPLGLVPGGTGNLLAGNLRLPRDPAAAARVILTGRTAAIDLGSVERADGTHYFAVCGGTGFDARLMAGTGAAEKRRWKMAAYVMRAFAALPSVTSPLHRVTVDGVARELPAAMVLVANCGELVPPFLRLRHDIAPDDGWLDVVVLRAEGVFQSLSAFFELVRRPANGARRLWFGPGPPGPASRGSIVADPMWSSSADSSRTSMAWMASSVYGPGRAPSFSSPIRETLRRGRAPCSLAPSTSSRSPWT